MNWQKIFEAIQKNEIRIGYKRAEHPVPLGQSKIGGKPHLPADFTWRFYEGETWDGEKESRPLVFLAQLNCAELHPFDRDGVLPETGMLYFFYEMESMCWGFDPADKGCAQVFYYDGEIGALQEMNFPPTLSEEAICPEMTLSFSSAGSLPAWEEFDEMQEACDCDDYDEAAALFGADPDAAAEDGIKLLGYADLIQGEMLSECEMVSRGIDCGQGETALSDEQKREIYENSRDWILLFQMGTVSENDFEWMWGDCGKLYFMIRRQDLAARNFDRVWLILQCY